jgi:uncharacterized protein (TIGR02300 family)
VTKAELGTKRVCPNCGARYYDLNRSPILCPRCGTQFELAAVTARARPAPVKAPVAEVEDAEPEKEAVETVSLEEADDEAAETGAVAVEGAEEEEDEIEAAEDDTFLADEDDDDEDVEDIVGDVDEEDT